MGFSFERDLERWLAAKLITQRQVDAILAYEIQELPPPPQATHRTLQELFAAVRAFVAKHPGATVLAADVPEYRFMGYSAFKVEGEYEHSEFFTIALPDLRKELMQMDPNDPRRAYLSTAEGRRRIALSLARPPDEDASAGQ